MNTAIETLTEKEKQALRLLVSGHDAKSMARQLGLSVHTINERLRDARRKLATSSSREAARVLHEAECRTPNCWGTKVSGVLPMPGRGNLASSQWKIAATDAASAGSSEVWQ